MIFQSHITNIFENFIGFWHNPHNMPIFFDYDNSPNIILNKKEIVVCFEKYCKGIFVFSNYLAEYLKSRLPKIPIEVIYHPTEIPYIKFKWEKYKLNNNKKIYQIGYWLRDLTFIWRLNTKNFLKMCYI